MPNMNINGFASGFNKLDIDPKSVIWFSLNQQT